MTNGEKIDYVLNKYPETKFNRADFFIKYMEEYQGVKFYITYDQFKAFWKDFAGVERTLRDKLRDKLPKEADSKRYEKAEEFRDEFRETLPLKEREDYNTAFNL